VGRRRCHLDSGAAARPPLMQGEAGARAWVGRCPAARSWGSRDGVEPPRWSDVVERGGRGKAGWPRCSSSRLRISTGGAEINWRHGNPARSRGSDGAVAWHTSCLLRSRAVVHRAVTAQERGPARGRAHGASRRRRGDEGVDEIASPREVGPSAVLDHDDGVADQIDPRRILRGRCPRRRSISPGAGRRRLQRKQKPRSKP